MFQLNAIEDIVNKLEKTIGVEKVEQITVENPRKILEKQENELKEIILSKNNK